eukprot:gene2147-49404_t
MVNALLLPLSDFMKQAWDGALPEEHRAELPAHSTVAA